MRTVTPFVISAALALAAAAGADNDMSLTIRGSGDAADCSDIEVTSRHHEVATADENLTIPGAALRIESPTNGGVVVRGWEGEGYTVAVCKAAVASTEEKARERVGRVQAKVAGGTLSLSGPTGGNWHAHLIVMAPRSADLSVELENGPLTIKEASGKFTIRGSNGPVSLADVAGTLDVKVQNGPVDLERGSGAIKIRAQNGPIDIELDGDRWEGAGLDARAQNGPLSLRIAEGYRSGVLIETSDHAPFECQPCDGGKRSWDDEGRQVQFGTEPFLVRLATENGPVSIESR